MLCPRCKVALERKKVASSTTEVDRCPQCAGVWFDRGEIAEVIGARAVVPLPFPETAPAVEALCPRCSTPLVVFTYPGTMTVIDACRHCRGVWLDDGELQQIHAARGRASMTCPKCGTVQPRAESCATCGVVVEKAVGTDLHRTTGQRVPAAAVPEAPAGLRERLLAFIDDSLSSLWSGIIGR
ncbi:MAG: zf-TFIIB domain-containing protein [Thermoanaerobaculia bacterium]